MSACTFFGHRDCLDEIKPKLREVLIDRADYAITYITHSCGGAAQSLKRAKARERRGEMIIINLVDV